ncbi:major facilitator superfamily domain-containing protein [Xylariaceae sp. FL1272]|nr:major facilitator superfamily domain-containing protein [Xylariaceae sp. FL1272]
MTCHGDPSPVDHTNTLSPSLIEPLSIQEPVTDNEAGQDAVYPRGVKLWTAVASLCVILFLYGLDLTIVAATVPSLSNQFKTVKDIGWYSSAYSLAIASFGLFFGKVYGIVPVKKLFMISVGIFEAGSLICTLATSSALFIVGRAVVGFGAAGILPGSFLILSLCFPKSSVALWTTVVSSSQLLGIIIAPLLGGALIDWVGWRGCFGINLPVGIAALGIIAFGLWDVDRRAGEGRGADLRAELKAFDWLGTAAVVPGLVAFLLAVQWGGAAYAWNDVRIIVLFASAATLLSLFGWCQYRRQEQATLPPRILAMKPVIAGAWYSSCVNSTLAVTEFYISIYFQGVKGYTALHSGVLVLPLLAGITVGNLLGGAGMTWIGYYNPCMIATSVLAPIATGLLSTVRLDESVIKAESLLGFLGVAMGVGLQAPLVALQTTVSNVDLPIALAVNLFGATLGNAVWIVVSSSIFHSRLVAEVTARDPSANVTLLEKAGLSEIREIVGRDRLRDVLLGYDAAVAQTLYLPVGLAAATVIGAVLMDWRSIKAKQL